MTTEERERLRGLALAVLCAECMEPLEPLREADLPQGEAEEYGEGQGCECCRDFRLALLPPEQHTPAVMADRMEQGQDCRPLKATILIDGKVVSERTAPPEPHPLMLEEIRAAHIRHPSGPNDDFCERCEMAWPCDAVRLLDAPGGYWKGFADGCAKMATRTAPPEPRICPTCGGYHTVAEEDHADRAPPDEPHPDTVRLDWLEAQALNTNGYAHAVVEIDRRGERLFWCYHDDAGMDVSGQTLREAIDAARAKGESDG